MYKEIQNLYKKKPTIIIVVNEERSKTTLNEYLKNPNSYKIVILYTYNHLVC